MQDLYHVIIPVGGDQDISLYQKIYKSFCGRPRAILLWVSDHQDLNEWLAIKKQLVIAEKACSRAARINLGLKMVKQGYVLVHHPRSYLDSFAVDEFEKLTKGKEKTWGGFTHEFFDRDHWALRFTSWYSNKVRLDLQSVVYLDHCLFFSRESLELIPMVDIFEDTEMSKLLRKEGHAIRLKGKSYTSAIRFSKNGLVKQILLNQCLKICYALGVSPKIMNRLYEKGLWLN